MFWKKIWAEKRMDVEQLQNLDLFAEFTDLCIDEGLEQDAESGDENEHDDMPEGEIGDAEELGW